MTNKKPHNRNQNHCNELGEVASHSLYLAAAAEASIYQTKEQIIQVEEHIIHNPGCL